jgi:hypothetical protein
MWSEQMKVATIRGLIIAILTGLLTTLTTWSQSSDAKTLVIAGATAFISTFLARSGLEGMYDTNRDRAGDVHASDVGTAHVAP